MEIINLPIQLSVELGQLNPQQQKLMNFHLVNHPAAYIAQLRLKAKLTEDDSKDFFVIFRYSVPLGRQAEAEVYFRQGTQKTLQKEKMSPLQFLISFPPTIEQEGAKLQIITEPGFVTLRYKLAQEGIAELLQLVQPLSKFPSVHLDLSLEGCVSHSLSNLTNVKVDHCLLTASSEENFLPIIKSLLADKDMLQSQMTQSPIFNTLGNLKKMNLNLKYKGFREMAKFAGDIEQSIYKKKIQKQDSKYFNSGLIKQNVSVFIIYDNLVGIEGTLKHHGEDVFMRLAKVYFKAAKKMR